MNASRRQVKVFGAEGLLTANIITPDPGPIIIGGYEWDGCWRYYGGRGSGLFIASPQHHNAFVNSGLQAILDRWAGIGGPPAAPVRLAVSSDTAAVTAATTTFGGTFRSSTFNATFPSRSGQTTSFQSDFTKGSGAGQIDFAVKKQGITNASTDAASAVQDIIGGTGGSSPYNEPLNLDMTGASSFTYRPQIDVTETAV